MGKHLDLDDVCYGNPEAAKELAELRAEVGRLRKVEKAAREVMIVVESPPPGGYAFLSFHRLGSALRAALYPAVSSEQTRDDGARNAVAVDREKEKGGSHEDRD